MTSRGHLAPAGACRRQIAICHSNDAITSCCSTDSDRSHRCCHLANNFGSHRIFPILYGGPRNAPPKCPFPWGEPGLHLVRGSLGPSESASQTASRSVQPFSFLPVCANMTCHRIVSTSYTAEPPEPNGVRAIGNTHTHTQETW